MKKYLFPLAALFILLSGILHAAPDAADIKLSLKKLNVLGSALYLAAHPDDENTAVLAYLSKELLLNTAYLSITRGSGGQNLLGTEFDELLGVLRTEELLAARRIDGATQFFTSARDFGYSKTPEETLDIWNRQEILADVVRIIRTFRPDIIITRFTPERGGHGHHRASAILALEAFTAAGDSTLFNVGKSQSKPWQPQRVFWNAWRWGSTLAEMDTARLVSVNTGTYNPLLGFSYSELSAASRSMHKSQGFGSAPGLGNSREYFQLLAGAPADSALLEGVDISWKRVPGSEQLSRLLKQAEQQFRPEQPDASLPLLLEALQEINRLPQGFWVHQKKKELQEVIAACTGLVLRADAARGFAVVGDSVKIRFTVVNRSAFPLQLERIRVLPPLENLTLNRQLANNRPEKFDMAVLLPDTFPVSRPYWLEQPPLKGRYISSTSPFAGVARAPAPLQIRFVIKAGEEELQYVRPVTYRWTDPVAGERMHPLAIAPRATLQFDKPLYIFGGDSAGNISVLVKTLADSVTGKLSLLLPAGWQSDPAGQMVRLNPEKLLQKYEFRIIPPSGSASGAVMAQLQLNGRRLSFKKNEIDYPHITPQLFFTGAEAAVTTVALNSGGGLIGYIMGSGDDLPEILTQMGYQVNLLEQTDIKEISTRNYKAIIAGIRAYNTNPWLYEIQPQLLDYVKKGGTYIVQYNVTRGLNNGHIGPYPFTISHDRVTVEDAEIKMREPDYFLLNRPNQLNTGDFRGWIQERVLYFASEW
ncbi:MAG: PIG-L family deacetylase, partial [Calditrichia bacterium]